jgi:hypothetical protein
MSTNKKPPDFDEDFLQSVKKWREQHKLQEDDAVLLLVELFRLHQDHWDELRRRQMPSLDQFRQDIASTVEAAKSLKEQTVKVTKALNAHPAADKTIPVTAAISIALAHWRRNVQHYGLCKLI